MKLQRMASWATSVIGIFRKKSKKMGLLLEVSARVEQLFFALFSGPVRTPALGGRSLICGAWTDRSSGEHYPGGGLVELPMKKDL